MFNLTKQAFAALLNFSWSLARKYISLNNEPCMARPTLTDLNLNWSELHYYTFMVILDKRYGSLNSTDGASGRICVPKKKKENVNWNVFNMITRINEAKALTKHILRDGKCKFNGRKCSLNQNNNRCRYECINLITFCICGNNHV